MKITVQSVYRVGVCTVLDEDSSSTCVQSWHLYIYFDFSSAEIIATDTYLCNTP